MADQVSDDRHALALRLHAQGRPAEAMEELAVEVRERLRHSELLNDLGVLAADVGQVQVAEAVLRTALLLAPDAAVLENLEVLDARREGGFLGRLMVELVVSALGPDLPDNFDPLHNPAGPPGPRGSLVRTSRL